MGCLYEFCNRFLHNSYGSCTAFPVGCPKVYDGDDDDDDDDDGTSSFLGWITMVMLTFFSLANFLNLSITSS